MDNYDYKFIVLGEPKTQQRHRTAVAGRRKNTGELNKQMADKLETILNTEVHPDDVNEILTEAVTLLRIEDKSFIHRYDPSAKDKKFIRELGLKYAPKELLDCPILVDIYCYFKRPQSHYRTGKFAGQLKPDAPIWCSKGIDRDNADKLILDALTGVFWINDSRICDGRIVKRYSERPRTEIYIKVLGNGDLLWQKENQEKPTQEPAANNLT